MKYKLKKQMVNVVWVSSIITPLTFSPEWFRRYELLREEDIDRANIDIKPDRITTDYGWLEITCSPTRAVFQLTKTGLESSLSDLTSSIFSMFQHAETTAVGVNTLYIYDFKDHESWNSIGDALVPKNIWMETNHSRLLQENATNRFGMLNVVVAIENESPPEDSNYKESVNVTYAPVRDHEEVKYGVKVQYNHDMSLINGKDSVKFTRELPDLIKLQIESAVSNDIASHTYMFERILS